MTTVHLVFILHQTFKKVLENAKKRNRRQKNSSSTLKAIDAN